MKSLILILLTACCCYGQTLLVPAYSPEVGRKAVASAGVARICLIVNPNDGPGIAIDRAYTRLFQMGGEQTEIVAYIDFKKWPKGQKWRWKTVSEIEGERSRYSALYQHTSGWFFDDADRVPAQLMAAAATWPGAKILNPGYATPPLAGFTTIIHEGPSWLQAAPPKHPCHEGAMALSLPSRDLPAAWAKASGLAYFYAHEKDDDWQKNQTAYNSLPVFWAQLVALASK